MRRAIHIEVMDLLSPVSRAAVLKLLTTDCKKFYQNLNVVTRSDGYETNLEGWGVIDQFHRDGIIVPSGTWDNLFKKSF
jgi:hypothetical protein